MFDVIIRRGEIYDGMGGPSFRADVGISGGVIEAVGKLGGAVAKREVDASDLAAAPGFIDIHTHSDVPLVVDGDAHSHVRSGVTTNVTGNCGNSAAPVTCAAVEYMKRRSADLPLEWTWTSLSGYLQRLEENGTSVNVVPLIGAGTIRGSIMGFCDRPPTDGELAEMQDMVAGGMRDGAFGLSTGLIYTPGSYADTDEIAALAESAARFGGIYATHIRGENDSLLRAVAEALEVGRRAEIPVQISHLKAMGRHMWGQGSVVLDMIEEARAAGEEVTGDQYPYTASATGLGAYLPPWSHSGGVESLMDRLRDPEARRRIEEDIREGANGWISLHRGVGWENTLITRCSNEDLEGRSITEIAEERGTGPYDCAFDILLECEGQVGVVYFTIGDEDLVNIMRHPAVMVGSDSSAIAAAGPLARGKPHPRAFGTFPRVLGHFVRERGVLTLGEAVRKMTSMPAQKLGLIDRGIIRPGMRADLVLFDPGKVEDRASYTDPFQYPVGISHVFVNGRETVREGEHLGVRAGQILERS